MRAGLQRRVSQSGRSGRHRATWGPGRERPVTRTLGAVRLAVFAALAAMSLVLMTAVPGAMAAKKKSNAVQSNTVAPRTAYNMPFPCGDVWTGSTRSGHSPSAKSVDFNKPGDLGAPAVAAAAGTVVTAQATPKGGYGRWVVIDHGNGESSLYAHLSKVMVTAGQQVDAATQIGAVGDSGRVSGPHLHFEQKKGRTVVPSWFGGRLYRYGTQASGNCLDVPLTATTGSKTARPAIYRRAATSSFVIRTGAKTSRTVVFGTARDEPIVGDWNGDGTTDVGVRKAGTAQFQLKTGNAAARSLTFGAVTDQPVAGDWDGDGTWEIGVYRSATNSFLLRLDTGNTLEIVMASTASVPLTGDFDGDGATDVAVYTPSTRTFTLRTVPNDRVTYTRHVLGAAGDLPVTGDWDGDGVTELGTWTPATAAFVTYRGAFAPAANSGVVTSRRAPIKRSAPVTFGRPRR